MTIENLREIRKLLEAVTDFNILSSQGFWLCEKFIEQIIGDIERQRLSMFYVEGKFRQVFLDFLSDKKVTDVCDFNQGAACWLYKKHHAQSMVSYVIRFLTEKGIAADVLNLPPVIDFDKEVEKIRRDLRLKALSEPLKFFWRHFKDNKFFFIGCVTAQISFRKFFESVTECKINLNAAQNFLYWQLRIDYREIEDLDDTFSDAAVDRALKYLRERLSKLKFAPFVAYFSKRNPECGKFFPRGYTVTPLGKSYILRFKSWNTIYTLTKSATLDYFNEHFGLTEKEFYSGFFGKHYFENGVESFSLLDLIDYEEIVLSEGKKPPLIRTHEEYFQAVKFLAKCKKLLGDEFNAKDFRFYCTS